MTLVRTPPRPAFEARARHERICPMCGGVPYTKRAHWHPECVVLWNLATRAALQIHDLKTVADRCWSCGLAARAAAIAYGRLQEEDLEDRGRYRVLPLELEHIRPLWSLSDAERRELKWWLPFNLQLLCLDVLERVTEIHASYGYELVDVVWPERIEPRPPRWDPDEPAAQRHYSAREREQFARETRE